MNLVTLIGRLTKKPEVRYTPSQTAVGRFTLAVDRMKKDDGADFIPVVVFGKQAENCEKYLDKGRQVAVQGRIQTGSYEKDGHKVFTTEVVADRVEFIGSAPAQQNNDGIPEGFQMVSDSDIPF